MLCLAWARARDIARVWRRVRVGVRVRFMPGAKAMASVRVRLG